MGHVTLLFGASRGIGAACSRLLFGYGATVCLAARDPERLEAARRNTGPSATAHVTDITKPDSVQATVDAVLQRHGRIDTVMNFAAETGPLDRASWEVAPQDLADVLRTNVTGTHNIIRSCLPPIQAAGRGALLFASSPYGDAPQPGFGVYGASRAAGNALVRQLAAELQGSWIGAALVYPGPAETEGLARFRSARGGAARAGRVTSAQEMAKLFVWAAMQRPWDINGAVLAWSNPMIRSQVEAMA